MDNSRNITESEWKVLEILWDKPGSLIGEIRYALSQSGWSYSTIKTLVARLVRKGAIKVEDSQEGKRYYPAVDEDKSRREETMHFIDRIYNGSVRMLFSNLVKTTNLSDKEAEELMELIDKMED